MDIIVKSFLICIVWSIVSSILSEIIMFVLDVEIKGKLIPKLSVISWERLSGVMFVILVLYFFDSL